MPRRASKSTRYSPALRRLGKATPSPFVGREEHFEAIETAFAEATCVAIVGPMGAGKSRLGSEIASRPALAGQRRTAFVRCVPEDTGIALLARAERALDALPGSLIATLRDSSCLLVVDDVHLLQPDDAAQTLPALVPEPGMSRVVFLSRETMPLPREDARRVDLHLEGLEDEAARALWAHLEDTYGETSGQDCDKAITSTRGMPLALREAYARATAGADAWDVSALGDDARAALEVVAVARVPISPAAVSTLVPEMAAEKVLIELVSRQLIDPAPNGRFGIHDVVRDNVLALMDQERRACLERATADLLVDGKGRAGAGGIQADSSAFGLEDPIDRLRERVHHLLAAGDTDAARECVIGGRAEVLTRGASGELLGLIEALAVAAGGSESLTGVRAEIAMRQGRVAEALELSSTLGDDPPFGPDDVDLALLRYRAGEVKDACEDLYDLVCGDDESLRGRAGAVLAECELDRGEHKRAQTVATSTFERDRARLDRGTRARLHMALAKWEGRSAAVGSARAALARARNAGALPQASFAEIDARYAVCLAREGRLEEAYKVIAAAEASARNVDAVMIADDVRRARALIESRAGGNERAERELRALVADVRARGDEIGALRAELDLADVLLRCGKIREAANLAETVKTGAEPRGLARLVIRAELVIAAVELEELRVGDAVARLSSVPLVDAQLELRAAALRFIASCWTAEDSSEPAEIWNALRESCDSSMDAEWIDARAALARRDSKTALDMARKVAVAAERSGRVGEMTDALAMMARLNLARGDSAAATSAATRAAREARMCGLVRAQARALVTLAAIARDESNVAAASAYAQDAYRLATESGLVVERLVAAQALEVISDADMAGGIDVNDARNAAAATMSEAAVEAAARVLADLGFTAARPYRVVSATGQENFVADANPGVLRMGERDLAIDGVREVIVRDGKQIADLRRRSLLKRLLFLFASAPHQTFSKEDIVQTVWNVDYHPLRHDAALFTNIMRIRRLLGKDGADLIRVSEDGYRFVPPKDFIYVGHTDPEA